MGLTVRIARGVKSYVVEHSGGIVLQVQDADDREAAWAGLVAAAEHVQGFDADRWAPAELDAEDPNTPSYVSEAMPAASGPFVFIDATSWPDRALRRLPELIIEQLEAAGVGDAVVGVPERGGPVTEAFAKTGLSRAVTAALFPPVGDVRPRAPRPSIPDAWLGLARQWLAGHDQAGDRVKVAVSEVEFTLGLDEVEGFLAAARAAATQECVLVAGELDGQIRAVSLRVGMVPTVALGAGGPTAGDDDLLAAYHELVAVVRQATGEQLGYGFVSFDPNFDPLRSSIYSTEWNESVGFQPGTAMVLLSDEMVFDGFAYQVLAPGHLARLGGLWEPGLGSELSGGRVELAVGEPAQWLLPADAHLVGTQPDAPPTGGPWRGLTWRRRDPQAQLAARGLLAPCLLTRHDATLLLDRYSSQS